ncbi:MAG: hypothetical protein HYV63_20950, partial [Candidatus Schekmanbacteria bacterium]|nr:hypothetical protein [Candidatus Schekmanbacteria bacterium]
DGVTGNVELSFGYDGAGDLTTLADAHGNTVTIERTGGRPAALVAPGGQRTVLSTDDVTGWLTEIRNPEGETVKLTYYDGDAAGLMKTYENARHFVTSYAYDDLGLLVSGEDAVTGGKAFAAGSQGAARTVTGTTALGRTAIHSVEELGEGETARSVTDGAGNRTAWVESAGGSRTVTFPDGTEMAVTVEPDPRWGLLAPVARQTTIRTPGGLERVETVSVDAPAGIGGALTVAHTVNGSTVTTAFDPVENTVTRTTEMGRTSVMSLDAAGNPSRLTPPRGASTDLTYDSRGLLTGLARGARTTTFGYGADRYLETTLDAELQMTRFSGDAIGRTQAETRPDEQIVAFSYDASGNLRSITPPGRPAHELDFNEVDLVDRYSPPDLAGYTAGAFDAHATYNADRQVKTITLPGGGAITRSYSSGSGRLTEIATPDGTLHFGYGTCPGE